VSDIIYGINPVTETLRVRSSQIKKIIFSKEREVKGVKELIELAKREKVPIEYKQRRRLDQLSASKHHQGVLAIVSLYRETGLDEIIKKWQDSGENLLALILDGIQDPQNLGALIRTACACGVHGVISLKDRAAPVTGTVFKTSAGALEHTSIARVINIAAAIDYLKERGAWIVGTSAESKTSLYDLDGTLDLVLVIGSEGRGIRPLVKRKCDFLVQIPLRGEISSLNASAAGAVALYEIVRQRYYQREKGLTKSES
jgi:23S rRNA (guanosine2251-2'-O)-methyltransferase